MQIEHGVFYFHHYDERYTKSVPKKQVENKMLVSNRHIMVKKQTQPEIKPEIKQIISDAIKPKKPKLVFVTSNSEVQEVITAYVINGNHTLICKVEGTLYVVEWKIPQDLHIKTLHNQKVEDNILESIIQKFVDNYKFNIVI